MSHSKQSRRAFLKKSSAAAVALTIIPRHVLGGKGYYPPSEKINIGFIGTGKLANGYFKNFTKLPEAQVIAACDVYSAKLEYFKSQVDAFYAEEKSNPGSNACVTYSEYRDLIANKDIDAVIVATPDHWHAIQSIEAMKAGKDVYCEKPLAHTIFEGRSMVKAAEMYGSVVQTGSMQRSWEKFRQACELVRNGYLGEISKVIVNVGDPAIAYNLPSEPVPEDMDWDRWCGPGPVNPFNTILSPSLKIKLWPQWRRFREYGGGILSDWGAHMFDIAQWGLGMDRTGPVQFIPPKDPDAKRGLKMIYANGVEMIHEDFDRGWGVRFIGSEGSLDVSRKFIDSKPEIIAETEIKTTDRRLYHSENHYQDWIDAIKKRTKPIADVETGHRSASVCNLANIAYQVNKKLKWDPVNEKFKGSKEANSLLTKIYREPFVLP